VLAFESHYAEFIIVGVVNRISGVLNTVRNQKMNLLPLTDNLKFFIAVLLILQRTATFKYKAYLAMLLLRFATEWSRLTECRM